MEDTQLLLKIEGLFEPLIEKYGFKITKHIYNEKAFGDSETIAQLQDHYIRIVKDRGEILFSFASAKDGSNWFDIRTILDCLGVDYSEELLGYEHYLNIDDESLRTDKQLRSFANVIQSNCSDILKLLGKNYNKNIDKLSMIQNSV